MTRETLQLDARRPSTNIYVRLEARETQWEITPGTSVAAWGYEGRVPGPLIVARVGDTLVAELVNHLPRRRRSTGTACVCRRPWTELQ